MSEYGTIRAVMTWFGDMIFCPRCAAYIHTHVGKRRGDAFFFWLRDIKVADMQTGQEEIDAFLQACKQGPIRDWYSNSVDTTLHLLREGMAGEQEELNERHCSKCLIDLKTLCVDYP